MVSLDGVGEERLAAWKADVDLGDHVGITGEVISSRRGELSVLASAWVLTSKALRPLPDKHHGLTDPECGSASATSTWSSTPTAGGWCTTAPPSSGPCATCCTVTASSRSRRRCCRPSTAARRPGRSRPTSTRSTST